jgi:hypothetical protein
MRLFSSAMVDRRPKCRETQAMTYSVLCWLGSRGETAEGFPERLHLVMLPSWYPLSLAFSCLQPPLAFLSNQRVLFGFSSRHQRRLGAPVPVQLLLAFLSNQQLLFAFSSPLQLLFVLLSRYQPPLALAGHHQLLISPQSHLVLSSRHPF